MLLVASALAPAGHVSARTDARAARRISLDLQDADVLGVLRLLAEVDGINVAATDDVKGKITLHLNRVPWEQALALVLRLGRLEASRDGDVLRVTTAARLGEEREALRTAA